MTDSQEVQRGEPQNLSGSPRAEGRPSFAKGGGGPDAVLALNVRIRSKGNGLAGGSPNRDSRADALKPPAPAEVAPPIFSVPVVTNAQRRRLKRAIESYRDEA
jgi:hypothetical protein